MPGIIFAQTLRRNWRQAIYWGAGIALLGMYVIILVPNVDMLQQYAQLMESIPPLLIQAFGVSDVSEVATPEGFIAFGYFSYIMLVMATYGVMAGMNVTANEEDRGIMDVLLSTPVVRWRVVLEKLLAYLLIITGIVAVSFVGLWIGTLATPGLGLDAGKLLIGSLNLLPATFTVLAFTIFVGALMRSRGTALALAAIFVVGAYFIDFLGNAASETSAAALRAISFYSYYGGGDIMKTGLNWGNIAVLVAAGIVLVAAGVLLFQRRDIGT